MYYDLVAPSFHRAFEHFASSLIGKHDKSLFLKVHALEERGWHYALTSDLLTRHEWVPTLHDWKIAKLVTATTAWWHEPTVLSFDALNTPRAYAATMEAIWSAEGECLLSGDSVLTSPDFQFLTVNWTDAFTVVVGDKRFIERLLNSTLQQVKEEFCRYSKAVDPGLDLEYSILLRRAASVYYNC